MEASILLVVGSNHWPIFLNIDVKVSPSNDLLDLKNFWLSHPDFLGNIQKWWDNAKISNGSLMYCFQQCLKNLKLQLKLWNKSVFGNIFQAQQQLESKMENLQQQIILNGRSEDLAQREK
jgi:hypothetical protein